MKKWLRLLLFPVSLIIVTSYISYTISWNMQRVDTSNKATPFNIYTEVNRIRVNNGKAELKIDKRLMSSAREKCSDMQKYNYYEHESLKGQEGFDLVFQNVPEAEYASENLNQGALNAKEFVDSWFTSPDHKKAMLDDRYSITGIAICTIPSEPSGSHTVVQHFAEMP